MSTRKLTRAGNSPRLENERDNQIDRDEVNHLVGMVIRYLLAVNRLKTAIHGDQIKKICLSGSTQSYSSIMTKVKQKLSGIFGYELIDIGGLKYILVNKINNEELESSSPDEAPERVLLFLTLTYIFMSCDDDDETAAVEEDDLWDFFNKLNIVKDENFQHIYFGNIKKLIATQFVDQLYLIRRKINNTEGFSYAWGPRADSEISRRSILNFVSKVYNDRTIESWPAQFAIMRNWETRQIEES